jgi:hypothetical protein
MKERTRLIAAGHGVTLALAIVCAGDIPASADESPPARQDLTPPTPASPGGSAVEIPPVGQSEVTPIAERELTQQEQDLLDEGEYDGPHYVLGGVVGTLVCPYGLGQAIQGRYLKTGWIFTSGEIGSLVVVFAGVRICDKNHEKGMCSNATFLGGFIALLGFHVWEILDLWIAPPLHDREVRRIRLKKASLSRPDYYIGPVSARSVNGITAGLSFSF